jgi:hypothetical protein
MITAKDIVPVALTREETEDVLAMAANWDFPGKSHIRNRENRAALLSTDAITGMVGQFAGHKYLYGAGARDKFKISRLHANQHKFQSDGGYDIDALNVDIKSTLRRNPEKQLLSYNLLVRPQELYAGWNYWFAIVDIVEGCCPVVHLLGWASDLMLPNEPAQDGIFKGAHVLPTCRLNPLPALRWDYFGRPAA